MPDSVDSDAVHTVANLKRRRGNLKATFTNTSTWLSKPGTKKESEARQRLRLLEERFTEFTSINNELIQLDLSEDDSYYNEIEEQYIQLSAQLNEIIETSNSIASSEFGSTTSASGLKCNMNVKLPKLSLPTFDGNPENWSSFYQRFTNAVELPTVSKLTRFQYLLTCVTGSAEELIRNIPVLEENYDEAVSTLKKRFSNKQLNIRACLQNLFSLNQIPSDNAGSLRDILNTVTSNVRALENLDYKRDKLANELLVQLVITKLDMKTREFWEIEISPSNGASTENSGGNEDHDCYQRLIDFLETRLRVISSVYPAEISSKPSTSPKDSNFQASVKKARFSGHSKTALVARQGAVQSKFKRVCRCCKGDHALFLCDSFQKLSIADRTNKVRDWKLCLNCFSKNHWSKDCTSSSCKSCGARHHTLLHPISTELRNASIPSSAAAVSTTLNSTPHSTPAMASNTNSPTKATVVTTALARQPVKGVLLATASVKIRTKHNEITVNALLDGASHGSFITADIVQALGLSTSQTNISVKGFGGTCATTLQRTSFTIHSPKSEFGLTISALVTNEITDPLPDAPVDITTPCWAFLHGYQLADEAFNIPKPVDILIGADYLYEILLPEFKQFTNAPVLQASVFGWLVTGPYLLDNSTKRTHCLLIREYEELERFWEIEEPPSKGGISQNYEDCEQHFRSTYQRINGRFVVQLPFSEDKHLGESRSLALAQFQQLALSDQYYEFMAEYESMGHMTAVDSPADPNASYFIPHHGVYHNDKLRVVFNASMKTTNGRSLNDALLVGPTLQPTLFQILTRFRQFNYVFSTDICKMYRQIDLHLKDRDYHRIWWWKDGQPTEYQLNTVTYGTASAPFLAVRCLLQLADDGQMTHPLAAQLLRNNTYMDDILGGGSSIEEAVSARDELIDLLQSCGMPLSKWRSNEPTLLPATTTPEAEPKQMTDHSLRTLGVEWDSKRDSFRFPISLPTLANDQRITKRQAASTVAKLFDPLGLLAPLSVSGKLIIQSIWCANLDWDDELPTPLSNRLKRFIGDLNAASMVQFPRSLNIMDPTTTELHGFSDASNQAYSACIYTCTTQSNGTRVSSLVCAKTRVAPTKVPRTIPELELCGAALLAKLMTEITGLFLVPTHQIFAYSDSTVVLSYLAKDAKTWKPFVANRVQSIIKVIPITQWRHVAGECNPADIATGEISFSTFSERLGLWLYGPTFLTQPTPPTVPTFTFDNSCLTAQRRALQVSLHSNEVSLPYRIPVHKFSLYRSLRRAIANILRYKQILLCRIRHLAIPTEPLSVNELNQAQREIFKNVQAESFPQETAALFAHQSISVRSTLLSLTPILHNDLIRVGGRIDHAALPFEVRHPIILPAGHRLAELLIRDCHLDNQHAGSEFIFTTLRRYYWFTGNLRARIKKCINRCVKCVRTRRHPIAVPMMAELPATRVQPEFPFSTTGVDFAGPLLTKPMVRTRSTILIKAYVAVFVCFTTRAVHLEPVSSLSTPAFLAALKRFISRRGSPSAIYSDNGTNFVGADNDLTQKFQTIMRDTLICTFATERRISWIFNPPASPHMGGLWEAAVRSMKELLHRTIGHQKLTFEELTTLLTQVEAVLNSRPILPNPCSIDAIDVLTPAHFLIGRPLTALPDEVIEPVRLDYTHRWHLLTQLRNSFWNRWSSEYLTQLQRRTKWKCSSRPFQVGDVVLLRDETSSPLSWPLGRITQAFPGRDGHTRVVELITRNHTILRRPVAKLVHLVDVDSDDSTSPPKSTAAGCLDDEI